MVKQILVGHTSPSTAFVVQSYPYGGLRCQKRFWLETNNKGTRLVTQTTNPKRTNQFDATASKPKASTYSEFSGALYLDENDHVQWDGVTQYTDEKKGREYLNTFGDAATNRKETERFVRMKELFEESLNKYTPRPEYGTALFKHAYLQARAAFDAEQKALTVAA